MKRVIITADDYGVCEEVNEGIRMAARLGSISSISAFSNFRDSAGGLKELSGEFPEIGIGVHLNLNTGRPVSEAGRVPSLVSRKGYFYGIRDFIQHLPDISEDEVYTEIMAQVDEITGGGIRLDHLSDHYGVLSFHPPFFELRNRLAREYGIPVRSPVTASRKYPSVYKNEGGIKLALSLAARLMLRSPRMAVQLIRQYGIKAMERKSAALDALGIRHPDLMIDSLYGIPTPENMLRILDNLPSGISEILVHPGKNSRRGENPSGLDTIYLRNREYELMTLTSPYLRDYLSARDIRMFSYSDIYK